MVAHLPLRWRRAYNVTISAGSLPAFLPPCRFQPAAPRYHVVAYTRARRLAVAQRMRLFCCAFCVCDLPWCGLFTLLGSLYILSTIHVPAGRGDYLWRISWFLSPRTNVLALHGVPPGRLLALWCMPVIVCCSTIHPSHYRHLCAAYTGFPFVPAGLLVLTPLYSCLVYVPATAVLPLYLCLLWLA